RRRRLALETLPDLVVPGHLELARPDVAAGGARLVLLLDVDFGLLPVHRGPAVAHHPAAEALAAERAVTDDAAAKLGAHDHQAGHRLAGDQAVEGAGGVAAAEPGL